MRKKNAIRNLFGILIIESVFRIILLVLPSIYTEEIYPIRATYELLEDGTQMLIVLTSVIGVLLIKYNKRNQ